MLLPGEVQRHEVEHFLLALEVTAVRGRHVQGALQVQEHGLLCRQQVPPQRVHRPLDAERLAVAGDRPRSALEDAVHLLVGLAAVCVGAARSERQAWHDGQDDGQHDGPDDDRSRSLGNGWVCAHDDPWGEGGLGFHPRAG